MGKLKNLSKNIYEHLKTRKKYNTLLLKYETLQDELDKKTIQLNTERRINDKRRESWEKALKNQEEEIIRLRKKKKL